MKVRQSLSSAALLTLLVVSVFGLYAPVTHFQLTGDDYQWVQHAHAAMHRFSLLFADLDTFYRPASTWTLVVDRSLWGNWPGGYHLTNVILHALCGLGLVLVGRRLGLRLAEAWLVGLLWVTSPFTLEPAASVAIRFEDLLLLAWIAFILSWPGPEDRWTPRRIVLLSAATFLAMMSKETWVVTPGIAFALAVGLGRQRYRHAVRSTAIVAVPVLLYVVAYFLAFPSDKSYFEFSFAPIAKVPHELAAFLWLEPLQPVAWHLTPVSLLAAAIALVLGLWGWKRRSPAALAGTALLLLPTIPTLLVPYLPTRYTSIPYAGFLLLLTGCWRLLSEDLRARNTLRILATSGVGLLSLLFFVAGVFTVRRDLADLSRASESHETLLDEARAFAPALPFGTPVIVVRLESSNPLAEIAGSVEGLPKLFYVRHRDPDGLIDTAALFEWVLRRENVFVHRYDDGGTRFEDIPGLLVAHDLTRFRIVGPTPDAGRTFKRLSADGIRARMVVVNSRPQR